MKLSPQNVVVALDELSVEKTKELMLHLGIKESVLSSIALQHSGANCKIHFVQTWLDGDVDASWKKLISGLKQIELNDLATNLQSTFGMCNVTLYIQLYILCI